MSRPTQEHARLFQIFVYGAITHYGRTFQSVPLIFNNTILQSYNPGWQAIWFGLFPFRSPLLRESHLIYTPRGTKMFQFPPFALYTYVFSA